MAGSRRLGLAVAGISLLFGAALLLTWRATEPAPAPAGGGPPPPSPWEPPPPLPAIPPPAAAGASSGPGGGAPRTARPRVDPAPAATPWPEVPIAARVTALGSLGGPVRAGLEAARDRMEYCFEEEMRRLERAPPPARRPGDPPGGPASLVLRLETREGVVEVVDTELDYLATSTPQLAVCCRSALRGVEFPAAGAVAGRRYRLKHLLQ